MSKLRLRFEKWLNTNPRKKIISGQIEIISKDFTIKFAEWLITCCFFFDGAWFFNSTLNNIYKNDYTLSELLVIFENNHYE